MQALLVLAGVAADKGNPPWQRAVSIMALQWIGDRKNAAALKKLIRDKTRVPKLKKTIGTLAKEVYTIVKKRR